MTEEKERAVQAWTSFFKNAGVCVTSCKRAIPYAGNTKFFKADLILHNVPVVEYNKQYVLKNLFVYIEPDKTKIPGSIIQEFSGMDDVIADEVLFDIYRDTHAPRPTLVLLDVPDGDEMSDIDYALWKINRERNIPDNVCFAFPFNFIQIDGSSWVVHPCITKEGKFALFGSFFDQLWKLNKLAERDDKKTFQLFKTAREYYKQKH